MSPLLATLGKRVNKQDMGTTAPALLDVWIYFNLITNTIFLPLLVATFLFSKRAKRHPTLVNVCMTWIFSGIFSLLLFYGGVYKESDPEPSKALCIAQTSLLYGITPMWSVAILVLVYHMIVVVNHDSTMKGGEVGRVKMLLMLSAPYIVQCAFTIATLIAAVARPDQVNRHRRYFYCALKFDPLSNAMTLFTFIMCLGIIALEIHLTVLLYRNWRGMRRARRPSGVDVQLILRVIAFGIYIFFGMVVNVVSLLDSHSLAPDMYAATVGTVVFLVFGTQPEVLRVWCFWLKTPPPSTKPTLVYLPPPSGWRQTIDLTKSASPRRSGKVFLTDLLHSPRPLPKTVQVLL